MVARGREGEKEQEGRRGQKKPGSAPVVGEEVVVASYSKMRLNSQGSQSVGRSVSQVGLLATTTRGGIAGMRHVWRQRNKKFGPAGASRVGFRLATQQGGPQHGGHAVAADPPSLPRFRCTTASRG